MDNAKDNRYYLNRILTDLRFLIVHTQDLDQEDLEENEVLQDSVMFRLIQISENSDKLTQDFKDRHPQIAWRALKGMRNRIVHNYGGVRISENCDKPKKVCLERNLTFRGRLFYSANSVSTALRRRGWRRRA